MARARVLLGHGSGGKLTHQLIESLFLSQLANPILKALDDSAVFSVDSRGGGTGRLAFTTDSYVVKPLFFPGGDIGRLAVCGTVNDLAVMGATPMGLSLGLIIEEGLEMAIFDQVIDSIATAAEEAGAAAVLAADDAQEAAVAAATAQAELDAAQEAAAAAELAAEEATLALAILEAEKAAVVAENAIIEANLAEAAATIAIVTQAATDAQE